ncbi:Sodium-dependent proline transporter [Lamellibrachia satsuma]|nr:Sodium-dependent proline transporter [Lamellibrachia satsuma]
MKAPNGDAVTKADDGSDMTQDFSKDENEERGNWTGRLDFLLSCLGYAVGLGNVWRFPYLCYKNGGAVFFIPYVIMLAFVGIPIFFMELSLGQFTSNSALTCWGMATVFKGIGFAMVTVSSLVAIYYNIIIAWAIFYFFASFTSDLPWQYCDRSYASPYCQKFLNETVTEEGCEALGLFANTTIGVCFNDTLPYGIFNKTLAKLQTPPIKAVIPSEEYLK